MTRAINELPTKVAGLFGGLVCLVAGLALGVAPAHGAFGAETLEFGLSSPGGTAQTQAGSHPFEFTTKFALTTVPNPADDPENPTIPDSPLRDIVAELPPGLIGDPSAVPTCRYADIANEQCPPNTVLGVIDIQDGSDHFLLSSLKVHNAKPLPGEAARFMFTFIGVPTSLVSYMSEDRPYRIITRIRNVNQAITVYGAELTLWGVPADPAHDAQRGGPAGIEPRALFTLPRACPAEPHEYSFSLRSWLEPDTWAEHTATTPATTGCESVPFAPQVEAQPTTSRADSPSGFDFTIAVDDPGLSDPEGIAASDLKKAVVTLPEGAAVNPSSADGLEACTQAQVASETAESDFGEGCPAASRIGSVRIETPLLPDDPLTGSIFLADPDDNPFDALLAGYIVAKSPERGVSLVLPGRFETDPETGRVVAVFDNNPQFPFSRLDVHFKSGPRAPLVTPSTCGTYEVKTELTPWSGNAPVVETDTFTIDQGPGGGACPAGDPAEPGDPEDLAERPFQPEMTAGTISNVAGSLTPFTFRLERPDGHQEILSTEVTPPAGVTARLAGIPLCPEEDAQAGACGPESRVGTAIAGAGAGPNPFYIQSGAVYLAGPYAPGGGGDPYEEGDSASRAPLSLVISVPAVAGPFDLGTVNVRAAVYVDPTTAQLRVVSDPIPHILQGIPLKVRDIRIRMDRERFTIAPTDCSEKQVEATAFGSHGGEAELESFFQADGCADLGFKPKLTFQATGGKKATKRNAHPGLRANLKVPGADAYAEGAERGSQSNIKRVQVTLPKGLFLDQASPALVSPCTRTQYAEGGCPASSRIGRAIAHTPLLDEPLSGPVYLRTSSNPLPDLVADLDGIVDIDLVGAVSQAKQRIRNTFRIVPDVPVSSFELRIQGGAKGLLVNSNVGQGLCGKKRRQVNVAMRAHNDRRHAYKTQMKAQCPKKAKKKGKKAKAKRNKAKRNKAKAKRS